MSEFQYYEWQTIDRPLTRAQQAEVDRLSSHIEVTSTRAVVTYSWGDFKHDPVDVLARYFDAFLYFANWGVRELLFRLPPAADVKALNPYLYEGAFDLTEVRGVRVLGVMVGGEEGEWPEDGSEEEDEEPDYEDYAADSDSDYWEGEETGLSTLAALRGDILHGDMRALYLAWLNAAQRGFIRPNAPEPPVPPGLGELNGTLVEFATFLGLGEHIIQAAAQASAPLRPAPPTDPNLIGRLPRAEADDFLRRLANDEPHLALALNRRLQELAGAPATPPLEGSRTWRDLAATAAALRLEAERQAQREAEAKRVEALRKLAEREPAAWQEVETLIAERNGSAYAKAVTLLKQLRDLAAWQGHSDGFQQRLSQITTNYARRSALIERIRKAGLT
jgi:hypothetical protein